MERRQCWIFERRTTDKNGIMSNSNSDDAPIEERLKCERRYLCGANALHIHISDRPNTLKYQMGDGGGTQEELYMSVQSAHVRSGLAVPCHNRLCDQVDPNHSHQPMATQQWSRTHKNIESVNMLPRTERWERQSPSTQAKSARSDSKRCWI